MMKRIIALLLALILTVGLLPTVALAAEGDAPTTDSTSVTEAKSEKNLNLVKTVTKEGDNYKVTLESWATGTVTSSSTPVPMDIILLLDQSGSMKKNFTSSSTETYNKLNKKNGKIYEDYRNNCYIKSGNQYLKVTVTCQPKFGINNDVYTYTWDGKHITSKGAYNKPEIPLFYKSTTSSSTTKIAALKTAVTSFIDKVNTEATTKNVKHRVAVVGFASTMGRNGQYENTELLSTADVVNYASANASASGIDYKNALVSATDKTRLSKAVDRLDANGDTYPEYGFDMANKIFAQYPIQDGDNRQCVVIMFTDGYPAPANTDNFDVKMANNAINNAKRCKDNNAKVYTIGIFDGADPSASIENYSQNGWLNEAVAANRYMHFSSSNYPSATALDNGGTRGEGNFYFAASNADALNDIFDTISEEISTDTTTLDGSATIVDNIPGNFTIPAEASGIKVYTAKCTGKTGETLSWEERQASNLQPTTTTNTTTGVKSVSVTGFDYSDEWCGLDENKAPHGSKLIIEFTIAHNNYGGTQPTNAGASIKDKENKDVITVDNPTVPVTISKPNDIFASAIEKTYDGTGFDILNKVAEKANSLANGTNNKFVDIEVKVKVDNTDYIYTILAGQTAGTWNQAGTPKTSPNVKATTLGTAENYEYPVTITFKDAAEGSTASNSTNTNAKFKINYAEVTVRANDKSKKTTEPDPTTFDATVSGMVNGENASEKLTYEITRADPTNNSAGSYTITPAGDKYQNNYEVTYETGTLTITKGDPTATEFSLTGKFQKTLNSNTADVPAAGKEFELSITGTAPTTNNTALTGNVTVAPTGSGTTFSDTKAFTFKSGTTGVTALTFTAPGEYKYEVKEVKPTAPVAGMKYDETIYTLTIEVTESNGALSITSAKVTKPGTTDMPEQVADLMGTPNDTFTITNTYTEPKEPRVVSKTVVTTDMVDTLPLSVSNDIAVFKIVNKVDILYPVVNGEASTLEVPYGTKSVTLLYKITVNAGTKTSMQFEDVGAECVSIVDDDDVDVTQVGRTFTVQFYRGVTTADIYVAKTYKNLVFDSNGECTVENVISEEIKATTTVTEKDPNKLTINFADYVQKELTATGTKTASDLDFTVDVKGKEQTTIIASAEGEEAISTYADEFDPKYSRTLTAHFDSITGGEVKTTRFTGTIVEIDHAGYYTFFLGEEKGTRTGVTYDEARYTLYINVRLDQNENKLYVSSMGAIRTNSDGTWENIALIEMVNDEPVRTTNYITFHNTIDTGKDDYYPIIIPTIINKDTGMLNKTDHFAYVIGYPDGTVHPNGQITRAEVATIFFRLLRDEVRDGAFTTSNSYSDVAYGKWYNNPISTMSALGIITGYPDGTFKPNKPITRAEFAAIAARFDETQSGKSATFSDVIGHWAAKEIGIAYYNDWIKGYPDGTFKPDQNITRAEAMTLINRVLERKPESPADLLTNMNKWTDNMDTSKWYYLDVQEATNSHAYTRKTFNYELWRQMLPDPDWSRYER